LDFLEGGKWEYGDIPTDTNFSALDRDEQSVRGVPSCSSSAERDPDTQPIGDNWVPWWQFRPLETEPLIPPFIQSVSQSVY
jgi:hypothetical protein